MRLKNYKGALDAKNISVQYNDSVINEANNQSISNLKAFYETEKQEEQIKTQSAEIKVRQEEVKRQQLQMTALIALVILMLVFGVITFRSYQQKKQANILLGAQNAEIKEKKNIIEEKHKEITDSINYAERIQRSFIATEEILNENLIDHFVFFQPKDIVSGDFYWASKLSNNNFAFVTADSTGHGVPGAIMSLLNVTSIESAIKDGFTNPSDILNATRTTIINRLKNDGSKEGGKDGMDCSLICFDFLGNKFVYSAANNPVWVVRKNELIELKADKMPVGKHSKDSEPFTQSEFCMQKNDVIYTLTDGFSDQFGGPKGKKFMYKKLKEILIYNSNLAMQEQKEKLVAALNNWKGELEQVDDICIIGVRV
jgi:serine phosphatase RsbU (regulator of sigma subunit)